MNTELDYYHLQIMHAQVSLVSYNTCRVVNDMLNK